MGDLTDHDTSDADFVADDAGSGDDSSQSLIAAASGDGSDVMQGLLLLGETQESGESEEGTDLAAVEEALAVAESETFVDDLTQGLGSTGSDEGSSLDGENLAAILNVDVSGDTVMLTSDHDFIQAMEDASAAAAA